jgi:hypothetical protein
MQNEAVVHILLLLALVTGIPVTFTVFLLWLANRTFASTAIKSEGDDSKTLSH